MAGNMWDAFDPGAAAPTDKPWYNDAYEVGRQVGAGAAVDLPRMAGQGLRWLGAEDSGRAMVEAADERAPGWEPDLQGRGLVAETLIKGGRAVAPMAPAIAASFVPGGQFVAPTVAAGLFGTSAAQDTEDKLRLQGIPDSEATSAGWRTGMIQGPLEGASMAVGGMAFKPLGRAMGLGGKTAAGVAGQMTDTAVLKPLAKGLGLNLLAQPLTEVAQDVGTEFNERSYGAKPEDVWDIAKDSAQGAIGLTMLLGPFAAGAHVGRARQAAAFKDALYNPDADPMVQAQARDAVVAQAQKQGVTPENIDSWLEARFQEDDALAAQAAQGERDYIQSKAQALFDGAPAARAAQDEKDLYDITADMRVGFANQQAIPQAPTSLAGTSSVDLMGARGNPLQQAMAERRAEGEGAMAVQSAAQQQAPTAPVAAPLTPEQEVAQQQTQQLRQRVEQEKATVAAQKARAESLGLKGSKAAGMLAELDALKDNGDITEAEHADSVVELGASRFKAVEAWLTEKFAPAADVSKKAAETNTSAPPVQKTPKTVQAAPVTAKGPLPDVPKPANPGEKAPAAPVEKAAPVAAPAPAAAPAKVQSVRTEVTAEGKTARVVRVAPALPVAASAPVADFRERNRAASTAIATLRAERKALVPVKGDETDVGNYGELDRTSPQAKRAAQIDAQIEALLPPVADIRAHVGELLALKGKGASVVLKSRLSAVTGISLGEDGTLLQAETPTPMAEVARREGVTKQAISKQLHNAGLSDLHIGRLVANDMAQGDSDAVQNFDASQDEDAERTSGYEEVTEKSIDDESSRISSSAAKAMGDGIVEVGGRDMTPEEKVAEREASLMIKRAAKATPEDAPTEADLAFEAKRREIAHAANMAALAQWSRTGEAANAVSDWDHYRSDAIPAFADLTQQQQLDWLKAVFQLDDRQQNDPRFIRNLQQTQERSIEPTLPSTGVAGQESNAARDESGAGANNQADGSQPAAKPAVVVKKRLAAAPAAETAQGAVATVGDVAPKKKITLRPKATTPAVAAADDVSAETGEPTWSALRQLSHDTQQEGDVKLGNDKFVTLAQAVAAARANMTEREWEMPFQFNRVLDIAPIDWKRMVAAMAGEPRTAVGKEEKAQFSQGSQAQASTVAQVTAEVREMMPVSQRLVVVDQLTDLPASVQAAVAQQSADGKSVRGFVLGGRAYLVAGNIEPGTARAVFLHEVGSHLGLDKLLSPAQHKQLADKVRDWASKADGSMESKLAAKALARVEQAGTEAADQNSELIAYFTEEAVNAGIDPTAMQFKGEMARWFRSLWAAFKTALRKLGINADKLTAQDVVDMAYGAARLEMAGAWHGTAGSFRKFDHQFMGTGEGAQAFGWGSYFAQRPGIAKGYFETDVFNKGGVKTFDGKSIKEAYDVAYEKMQASGLGVLPEYDALSALEHRSTDRSTAKADAENTLDMALRDLKRYAKEDPERYNAAHAWLEANSGKLVDIKSEGAMMRTDFNVADDEWLDLDKPLSEQSAKVQSAFSRDGKYYDLDHKATGKPLMQAYERTTGREVYDALEEKLGSDKAASEYLDSIGIKGNKFLDANSRHAQRAVLDSSKFGHYMKVVDAMGAVQSSTKFDRKEQAQEKVDTWNRLHAKDEDATRNLVVFNDKNIQRVASLVGADAGKVKFSVGQTQANQRLAETGQAVGSTLTRWMQNVGNVASFTEDLIDRAVKAGMSSARSYQAAQAARGAEVRAHERRVHAVLEKFSNLPYAAQQTANKMLYDSTREAKWAYAPAWDSKAVVDPVMAARFKALEKDSPAAARFIKAAFQHGQDTLAAKKKAALDHVETEYAALIEDVKMDPEAVALLQKERKKLVERFASLFSIQGKGPYAPLRRDGDFLVMAKSKAFLDAEKNADSAAIEKLMRDPDHYMVSMAKTEVEGVALAKALRDSGKYDSAPESVLSRPKEAALQDLYGGSSMMGAFLKLKSRIEAERGETTHEESGTLRRMNQMVTQMYLESLSEGSARKGEMRRIGVSSQNMDMVAGFAAQGVADAQFMASVAHGGEILKAIGTMRKEWKGSGGTAEQTAKGKLFNEIVARHVQSMDFKPTRLADGLTRAASIWMLATSPAYYLANMTQTWLISLPYMTKQHGYSDAAGAIFRAYGDVKNLLGTAKLFSSLDFAKVPAADRKAIQALLDMGVIDAGLDTDMGSFKVQIDGKVVSGWNKVDSSLRIISQKVEAINRLSAGLASYRLELARTQSHDAAVEYARNVITQTHGDYTRGNAPRAFNTGAGKVALQFRKFQLIQIGLIGSLVKQSFAGSTAQEKAMARKALGFMFAHLGVVGGAIALPGYALIGSLAAGLLGGDGPDDADEMIRKAIGDKAIADLLLNGLPGLVGVGIGDRIGFGKIASALPFSKAPVDRTTFKETAYDAMTGPFGGLALKAVSGLQLMAGGEFYKGMEYLLPNGLGNALKAGRYATEGVTNTKGELLMNADEIRVADTFMQALGITPLAQTRRMELQNAKYDLDGYFSKQSSAIRKSYIQGDKSEAMQAWREMNEVRAARGYKVAPVSDLVKAPMAAAKRARMVAGGVQFDKSNRGFVEGSSRE